MAKYLLEFSYTLDGTKGLLKEGGSKRKQAVEQLCASLGAKLEAMYFSFGAQDGFVIIDGPDNASVAAASLTVSASGAATVKTVVLLTAEEIDQATKKAANYRPPGK